jgi:uncharacterized membrane protein YkvA (DUF1232 family)
MVLIRGWMMVPVAVRHTASVDLGVVAGIVVGLVALWAILLVVFWALRPRDVPLRELLAVVPDLVRLLRVLVTDRTTPLDVRLVLLGLVAWILSPIDLIPEFIPVLGPLDDVVVAVVALRYVRRRVGLGALRDRWPGSPEGFALLARVVGGG